MYYYYYYVLLLLLKNIKFYVSQLSIAFTSSILQLVPKTWLR